MTVKVSDFFKSYFLVIIILGKAAGRDINEYPILKSHGNSEYVFVMSLQ